ncbi:MAG: CapA family protein [Bacteroidota bacterium]
MKIAKPLVLLVLLASIYSSCKVAKQTGRVTNKTVKDTTQVVLDTVQTPIPLDTLKEEENIAVLDTVAVDTLSIPTVTLPKDTITIMGVGDIMMGTNYPNKNYLPPNDGKDLFNEVDSILRSADVTFGNLEGVILDEGGKPKYCKNPSICYLFRTPTIFGNNLTDAGFDVMSLANNHAGDFGNPGRRSTTALLDSLGIHYAGLLSQESITWKQDSVTYGFAAFAPNTGTVSINDLTKAKSIVSKLDSICDIVIVSFHGGAEGSKYEHVTRRREIFYGENRGNVYTFAHQMVDAGADIIFGHGPHVTRAIEVYKDRFISYSLGNFCTYARFNLSGPNGIAPIIAVRTTPKGVFLGGQIISTYQVKPGGPRIDPDKRVVEKIRQLTEKDFPETQIKIDETGNIEYIKIKSTDALQGERN